MKRQLLPLSLILAAAVAVGLVASSASRADRAIIGSGSDDDETDAGPPPATPPPAAGKDAKKPDDKKPDDKKKADDKKADKKTDDKKADDKKPDDKKAADGKKPDDKAAAVKKDGGKVDVLEDTPAEKAAKAKDAAAKDKADKAADDASKKKEAENQKLLEQKKAADDKKRLENKDQRLAAAKRIRQITRTSGAITMSFAIEPGYVLSNQVVEMRIDIGEKLEVADPRYGNLMPQKDLEFAVVVTNPGKAIKQRYEAHALEAPGRYGVHTTPLKDGVYQVSIEGTTHENKAFSAQFPLYVGTWPPPDFEQEEKNNAATDDVARGGRKVLGGE